MPNLLKKNKTNLVSYWSVICFTKRGRASTVTALITALFQQ
jgi:hypothetical protein